VVMDSLLGFVSPLNFSLVEACQIIPAVKQSQAHATSSKAWLMKNEDGLINIHGSTGRVEISACHLLHTFVSGSRQACMHCSQRDLFMNCGKACYKNMRDMQTGG
jgi:hypothetical protein